MIATDTVIDHILSLAAIEAAKADAKHGENRTMPLGTGSAPFKALRDHYTALVEEAAAAGTLTWSAVALEEFFEALAEADSTAFAYEALQTIGVLANAIKSELTLNPTLSLAPPF